MDSPWSGSSTVAPIMVNRDSLICVPMCREKLAAREAIGNPSAESLRPPRRKKKIPKQERLAPSRGSDFCLKLRDFKVIDELWFSPDL